jgi:hypothetical protein
MIRRRVALSAMCEVAVLEEPCQLTSQSVLWFAFPDKGYLLFKSRVLLCHPSPLPTTLGL